MLIRYEIISGRLEVWKWAYAVPNARAAAMAFLRVSRGGVASHRKACAGLWKLAVRRPKIVDVQRRQDGCRGDRDRGNILGANCPGTRNSTCANCATRWRLSRAAAAASVERLFDGWLTSLSLSASSTAMPRRPMKPCGLCAAGGRAASQAVDITDYAAVQAAVREIEIQHGPTDILVNNAGWDQAGNFLDTSPSVWDKLIAINLTGPLNLHHIVLRGMVSRGGGRVVNIASDAARVGSSGEAVYAAAKAGVVAFTKTVVRELASLRITLNVVCPGPPTRPSWRPLPARGSKGTNCAALERAIPFKRLGQPDDVAGIVAFLSSDEAGYITGQVISVSGGLTMHGYARVAETM